MKSSLIKYSLTFFKRSIRQNKIQFIPFFVIPFLFHKLEILYKNASNSIKPFIYGYITILIVISLISSVVVNFRTTVLEYKSFEYYKVSGSPKALIWQIIILKWSYIAFLGIGLAFICIIIDKAFLLNKLSFSPSFFGLLLFSILVLLVGVLVGLINQSIIKNEGK